MADNSSFLLDITKFGQSGLSMGSPAVEAKKAQVQMSSLQKQATLGDQETQRVIATADQQGNRLADDQGLRDLNEMSKLEYGQKYGWKAAMDRADYFAAQRELDRFKNAERSTGDVAKDAAIDTGLMAANTAGSAVDLGLAGMDAILGTEMSPVMSQGLDWMNQAAHGAQSQLMQDRREQHALEGELARQDRATQYAEDQAAAADADNSWDRTVMPWLKKQGGAVTDTVMNYADDPIMMGSLVPEGVGSLLPATGAIKVLGKTRALRKLAREGLVGEGAEAFLKTPAGRKLLETEQTAAAPMVMGASEGGAAVSQTQQQILAMSDEELAQSDRYEELKAQDLSNDEIRSRLARDAGIEAGMTAIPGALASGAISARFAANPLTSNKGKLVEAVKDTASEGTEEFLQEANSQLASNVALDDVGGFDVALDEGVAEAGTQGALGGLATAGPMQTPGAAAGATKALGKGLWKGAKASTGAVLNARDAQLDRKSDASSPVGSQAQVAARDEFRAAGEELLSRPTKTTPNQTEEGQTAAEEPQAPSQMQETVKRALFVDPEEADQIGGERVGAFRAENPDSAVPRELAIQDMADVMNAEDGDVAQKLFAAAGIVQSFNEMARTESDQVTAEIEQRDDADPDRLAYGRLTDQLRTMEQSPEVRQAVATIEALTPEVSQAMVDMLESDEARAQMVDIISSVNVQAFSPEQYDTVLDQVGGGQQAKRLARKLSTARDIAEEFRQADAQKTELRSAYERMPEATKAKRQPDFHEVRDQINVTGNQSNSGLSLDQHRRRIAQAFTAGRIEQAQGYLEELRNFAQSQANKVAAYNQSAGMKGLNKVPFQAWNPDQNKWFEQAGVYAQVKSANSMAMATDAFIDSRAAAQLYNSLIEGFNDQFADDPSSQKLPLPELDRKILRSSRAFFNMGLSSGQSNPNEIQPAKAATGGRQPARAAGEGTAAEANQTTPNQTQDEPVSEVPGSDDVLDDGDVDGEVQDAPPAEDTAQEEPEAGAGEEAPGTGARAESPEATGQESDTSGDQGGDPVPEAGAGTDELIDETDAVAEEDPAEPETSAEEGDASRSWFDGLSDLLVRTKDGINHFLEAFRPRREPTPFASLDRPAQWMLDNMAQLKIGKAEDAREFTDEEQAAVRALLKEELPEFAAAINERLNKAARARGKKAGSKSWIDRLDTGMNPMLFERAQALSLATRKDDGSFEVEPKVMTAAYMAVTEWMLANATKGRAYLDNEDVSKMFGLGRNGVVTGEMRDVAQFGTELQPVLEDIANRMQNLLGVSPRDDVTISKTQGVLRGMAANALEQLVLDGDLEVNGPEGKGENVEVPTTDANPNGFKRIVMIRVPAATVDSDLVQALKTLRDPFSRVLAGEFDKHRYVNEKPTQVSRTQMGNDMARLTRQETQVLERLQAMPHKVNGPLFELLDALGDSRFMALMGYRELTQEVRDRMNQTHLKSVEGKNASILHGLEGARGYFDEAAKQGDPAAAEIFFKWGISSVGRLQQQGPSTPQGDKITRELISATNATLDLNDEAHQQALWLGVAQSLDISIEKMSYAEAQEAAQELVTSEDGLASAVEMIQQFLNGEGLDADALAQSIQAADVEFTPKLLHALLTVARANEAMGTEAASQFQTALAVEADGKTDGPVNAMIHMGTGAFTSEDIERFAKGGLFFTSQPISLNDFIEHENAGFERRGEARKRAEDLYNMAARLFESRLVEKQQDAKSRGEDKFFDGTMRILSAMTDDFTLGLEQDEQPFEVGRNVVKNPLTVFLYGSGEDGIAGKIADQVMATFYSALSDIAAGLKDGSLKSWQEHPLFAENPGLADLLAEAFDENPDAFKRALQSSAAGLEIKGEAIEYLRARIRTQYAEPMLEAIDEATGGLRSNMRLQQKAATVQAMVFKDIFDRTLARRTKDLDGLPSKAQMKEIYEEVSAIAPVFKTQSHEFHIVKAVRQPTDKTISASLGGRFSSRATELGPDEPSVRVSPYMTIGTGDGQMILSIYLNGDGALETSLPVFDGVEQSLDQIDAASPQINKAVFDGWMGSNVFQSLADGFWQMSASMSPELFGSLSRETKSELRKTMAKVDRKTKKLAPLVRSDFFQMQLELQDKADESAARKLAIQSLASQTDHMAGAEAPHTNEGQTTPSDDPTDYDGITRALNEVYDRELARIRDERLNKQEGGYAQEPTEGMQGLLSAMGEEMPGHDGVRRLYGDQLAAYLVRDKEASNEQRILVRDVLLKDSAFRNAAYYFGTPEQLEAFRDAEMPHLAKQSIQLGQAHPEAGVVFVANASPETVLHEMLHTQTHRILKAHYADPAASKGYIRDAVKRLEAAMAKVEKMVPDMEPTIATTVVTEVDQLLDDGDTDETPVAAQRPKGAGDPNVALMVLQNTLANTADPADRMSEFISYMLSNQELIETGKKKRSYGPLIQLVRDGLEAFKRLLGLKVSPGRNLFSNIRFDTSVLLTTPEAARAARQDAETDAVLDQAFGGDARLQRLEQRFLHRLSAHLRAHQPKDRKMTPEEEKILRGEMAKLRLSGHDAAEFAIHQGYRLTPREAQAFEAIHAAMMSGMKMDAVLTRQANMAYGHVIRSISAESFLDAQGITNPSEEQYTRASMQADFLVSAMKNGATGRTDLLASFVALSQVSPEFRAVLDNLTPPKTLEIRANSFDGVLRNIANSALELLTRLSFTRREQPRRISRQLDILADSLSEVQAERRFWASMLKFRGADQANDYVAGKLSDATKRTVDWIEARKKPGQNKAAEFGLNAAQMVVSFGDKDTAAATGETWTRIVNHARGLHMLREVLNDLRGATDTNRPLLRLVNVVKARIDAMRQDYREGVPEELAKPFSRKLDREEWSRMHKGLARTDLVALGRKDALDIMAAPDGLADRILDTEEQLQQLGGKFASRYEAKARALAEYMVNRKVTSRNLLPNAWAIAHLFNEQGNQKKAIEAQVSDELVRAISRLTSLYAYEKLDQPTKDTLKTLSETEVEGMTRVTGFLHTTRQAEIERRDADGTVNKVARNNGWKGYVPALNQQGSMVAVAEASRHEEMIRTGFTKIGEYKGDRSEKYAEKRAYYQSSVSGRNAFRQGVAQTVHASFQGVDARTGQTRAGETAGLFLGQDAQRVAKAISERPGQNDGLPAGDYLIPRFGENGEVTGFERPMDPDMLEGLQRDTHLGRMLGVWMGRIVEEQAADEFNKQLVEELKAIHDRAVQDGREDEFINVADPKNPDPVVRDAWGTLGWKIKENAAEVFGESGYLPVRKDMVNDAIGFRSAGVTDAWTGITRWNKDVQEGFQRMAYRLMGNSAYTWLKKGEQLLQDGVSYAKTTIIVRSMVVAWDNILSNGLHLMMRGVNPLKAAKGMRDKFVEITQYVKNREEIQALGVELASVIDQPARAARIKARIQSLEDANAGMSIAPLIEAGEFSTISENLTEADVAIREGRWGDFMENAADKLPGALGTVAKNVLITKDTALFQGLNRMVQYGDFVAKAVLYDHLTEARGMDQQQALDEIMEEFVQYNRLPGRSRDFLESHGLLWFYNYKLRIMKIVAKMARERPLSALMMMGGVGPSTGIDSVGSGSLAGAILDNRIGYSMGPEMGWNAMGLNPFWNAIN